MKKLYWTLAWALLCGCVSRTYTGGSPGLKLTAVRIYLGPFQNATTDENAARSLAELTSAALAARGIPVMGTEGSTTNKTAATDAGDTLRLAREAQATHLLTGTVHEYRYKSDLNGDPAVGLSLRLIDLKDGRTIWQGSSSQVGIAFASLTSTAQKAVHKLIAKLPAVKAS